MAVEPATSLLTYAERIRELEPGIDLSLAELNSEGLANDVVLFEDIVFRFPKTDHARHALRGEVAVLNHLRGRLSVQIPAPSRVEADVVVYPRLKGRTLDQLRSGKASGRMGAPLAARSFRDAPMKAKV